MVDNITEVNTVQVGHKVWLTTANVFTNIHTIRFLTPKVNLIFSFNKQGMPHKVECNSGQHT